MQRTQDDIVRDSKEVVPEQITERVVVPGINNLHERSINDIVEVFTTVFRSRNDITKITYVVGSHFEITSRNSAF